MMTYSYRNIVAHHAIVRFSVIFRRFEELYFYLATTSHMRVAHTEYNTLGTVTHAFNNL